VGFNISSSVGSFGPSVFYGHDHLTGFCVVKDLHGSSSCVGGDNLAAGRFRPTAGVKRENIKLIGSVCAVPTAVISSSGKRIGLISCEWYSLKTSCSHGLQPWGATALRSMDRQFCLAFSAELVNGQFIPPNYRNGDTLSRENVAKSLSLYIFLVF
jgi:hypothetical protein